MNKEEYLSKLNSLRGLFAVEIVLGHVVRYENSPIFSIGKFMIISVAFFFFISGMGMSISFEKKNDYLKKFLHKKCGYLLFLALFTYLFYCIINLCISRGTHFLFFKDNLISDFITTTNWYIWELMLFYALFWALHKFVKNKKSRLIFLLLATSAGMILSYLLLQEAFYASSLAFPLGVCWGYHYDSIKERMHKPIGMAMTALFCLGGLSCFIFHEENFVTMVVLRNSMCIGSLLLLFYLLYYTKFKFGGVIRFLNTYSTEIYLFQFIWLFFTENKSITWPVRFLIVFLLTLGSALLTRPLIQGIRKKVFA